MTEPSVTDTLRGIQFLRELSDELLDQLAAMARVAQYAPETVIFRQGEAASTLHLIISGNVSLEICAPGVGCKRILTIGPGELLGRSPVLEQGTLTATARTISEVRTVSFSGPQILAICEQNPRFGYEFMKRAALALAKRLSATRLQLLDVFGTQMPAATDERTPEAETH